MSERESESVRLRPLITRIKARVGGGGGGEYRQVVR